MSEFYIAIGSFHCGSGLKKAFRMKHLPIYLVATLAPAISAPAAAQPVQAAPADAADQLINLILNPDKLAQDARTAARAGFMKRLDADPNIAKMEQLRPGLILALRQTLDTELSRAMPAAITRMRERYRELFTQRLTVAELVEVRDFYLSPVGQRMLAQSTAAAQAKAMDIAQQGGRRLDEKSMQAITNEAAVAGMQIVRPEDVPQLTRFAQTTAAQKMIPLQQEANAIAVAETNAMIDTVGPRLGEALKATLERHMRGGR
ncbi:DUF2059 domain-containing protein [Sphingomonas sp.]|uniref:DUF2059 domain-containing protein n=1 Tax=Sphingomonas sp. TaxID=28214 RepID=UPI002DBE5712|nr:DUF2059 domain-containing protein [Sphingomonas sp.]HEU4967704.1 DUF2059 domain-containing protein [Sphingomonas sp.]